MKIILLSDISKLGKKYDVKEVNSGHAINFLIPKGLAIVATPEAIKRVQTQKTKTEGEREVQKDLLLKNLKDLEGVTLTIVGKANDKGHLFAGLHGEDIAKELYKQTKLSVDPSSIQLEHPLKEVGEHTIEVRGAGKSVKFKVLVKSL